VTLNRHFLRFTWLAGLAFITEAQIAPRLLAQPPLASNLSLHDALVITLKTNPALIVQEAAIEQNAGLADQASGAFDWNVVGTFDAAKDKTPLIAPSPAGPGLPIAEPVESETETSYSLGVDKLFRNGISIEPSASVLVQNSSTSSILGTQATPAFGSSNVNMTIMVPLLRGLGVDDTGAAEAAARGDIKVARLLYQQALASESLATATSYWTSRSANEQLRVQRDQEAAAERIVKSTKTLVDSRAFPPAFLIQAQANLAAQRTVRIEAELAAKTAQMDLGQALGISPEELVDTPEPIDPFPAPNEFDPPDHGRLAALVHEALVKREDYLAQQASVVPLNILVRQAELELKPQLNLVMSGGYQGVTPGMDYVSPLNHRLTGGNESIGLSMAWPINNTYQKGLLRERRGDVRSAQAQTETLARAIATQVLISLEQVRLSEDAVRSGADAVAIAKKAIAAQNERVRSGEGTILDLISLENLSASARINYISDEAAYATAVAQLRFALGQVFDHPEMDDVTFSLADLATLPKL
jgi:outer membrane protein